MRGLEDIKRERDGGRVVSMGEKWRERKDEREEERGMDREMELEGERGREEEIYRVRSGERGSNNGEMERESVYVWG